MLRYITRGVGCLVLMTGTAIAQSCDPESAGLSEQYFSAICSDQDGDGNEEISVLKTSKSGTTKEYVFQNGQLTSVKRLARGSDRFLIPKALSSVCRSTRGPNGGEVYKSIASKHLTDARKFSTSFITLRGTSAPSGSCINAYDKKGNLVHKLGQYFPSGAAYSSRFYGGYGCGDHKSPSRIASAARSKTGSSEIYIKVNSSQCVKIQDPTRCYNSIGC